MKKYAFMAMIAALLAITACGPSAKELEEKRISDSIKVADSIAAADTVPVQSLDTLAK